MKTDYIMTALKRPSDEQLAEVKQALVDKGVADENISNDKLDEVIKSLKLGGVKALFDAKKSCYCEFYQSYVTDEELETLLKYTDTSNVTSMESMFNACYNITKIPIIDSSNVTTMAQMFYNCISLIAGPQIETSNVMNMSNMFGGCKNLTTIPAYNVSLCNNFGSMFYQCSNLESILMYGMKFNFDISASTKFTRDALVTILNNLATVTSTKKLTMGSTNLAKLTDEDKAIATNKGWTLA